MCIISNVPIQYTNTSVVARHTVMSYNWKSLHGEEFMEIINPCDGPDLPEQCNQGSPKS